MLCKPSFVQCGIIVFRLATTSLLIVVVVAPVVIAVVIAVALVVLSIAVIVAVHDRALQACCPLWVCGLVVQNKEQVQHRTVKSKSLLMWGGGVVFKMCKRQFSAFSQFRELPKTSTLVALRYGAQQKRKQRQTSMRHIGLQ